MIFHFSSADAGTPPALSGSAGALRDLLQTLLVDGYNADTPTSIEQVNVSLEAVVYHPGHPYSTGQVVAITGCTESEFNVTDRIYNVSSDYYSYTMSAGIAAGTFATGSPASQLAPVGWYVAADDGMYSTTFSNPWGTCALAVDDTNANDMRVRGFSSVSFAGVAEGNGFDPFPTDSLAGGPLYICKSTTADSTVRDWYFVSDGTYINLFVRPNGTDWVRFGFGQFPSFLAGDTFNFLIEASESALNVYNCDTTALGVVAGMYAMRDASGAGSSSSCGRKSFSHLGGARMGASGPAYPAYCRGGLLLDRVMVIDADATRDPRGWIPGVWNVLHNQPLASDDIFQGSFGGPVAGASFRYLHNGVGSFAFEDGTAASTWTTAGTT